MLNTLKIQRLAKDFLLSIMATYTLKPNFAATCEYKRKSKRPLHRMTNDERNLDPTENISLVFGT